MLNLPFPLGELAFAELVELLHPTQAVLGREVNPKLYSIAEFTRKARKEAFLRDVLAKPKIFVIGDDHDLAELTGH